MNPKKEFVKAIMSVLRLEDNIYTIAAIEEIIDRIDTKDYTMFIAYLGERNSDFEKPIQTIAKATEYFYEKINKPKRLAILEIIQNIEDVFNYSEYMAIEKHKKNKNGKLVVSKNAVEKEMLNISTKRIHDFSTDGISLPYSSLEPLIKKCGSINNLIDIYLKDKQGFHNYLIENSGIKKYQKLNITAKIDKKSKEDIDNEVLGLINKKLFPKNLLIQG